MQLNDLISMGGYGIYIWPAYTITFGVFLINWLFVKYEQKKLKKHFLEIYES